MLRNTIQSIHSAQLPQHGLYVPVRLQGVHFVHKCFHTEQVAMSLETKTVSFTSWTDINSNTAAFLR